MGLVAVVVTALIRPPATTTAFSTKVSAALGRTAAASALYASSRPRQQSSPSNNNPSFSTLIGDMASSILGSGKKSPDRNPELDAQLDRMEPSWKAVRARLESQQPTAEERKFRARLAQGYGVGSPLHRVRLFDESNREEDIRVTFYRCVVQFESFVLCFFL